MTKSVWESLSEEAVSRARASLRGGELGWKHTRAEVTNDPDVVASTLDSAAPLAWTAPVLWGEDGNPIYFPTPDSKGHWTFLLATDRDSIRDQYDTLRDWIDIQGWDAFWEIRQNWYLAYHGVGGAKVKATGDMARVETVAVFPVGGDGILGEMHFSIIGADRKNRWPEVPSVPGDIPNPAKRLEAMALYDRYMDAVRNEDVDGIVDCHRADSALCIRNYLIPESTHLNTGTADEMRQYYTDLFNRYKIRNLEVVHKLVDTWYVFAELFWRVEERTGEGRVLEFCTAEVSPLDPDCKIWTRNGGGTDPVVAIDDELPFAYSRLGYAASQLA